MAAIKFVTACLDTSVVHHFFHDKPNRLWPAVKLNPGRLFILGTGHAARVFRVLWRCHSGQRFIQPLWCTAGSTLNKTADAVFLTQIFRKAENGPAFLARVWNELHMRIQVVPQVVEGQLGYLTALSGVAHPTGGPASCPHTACKPPHSRPVAPCAPRHLIPPASPLQVPSLHITRARPAFKSHMCLTQ